VSFATQPREVVSMWGQLGALARTRCAWCGRELRPCNLPRHVAAAHFRQLTIDEVLKADAERTGTMERVAEIYEDAAGEFRWRVKAGNGEIVATGEGHPRRDGARRGLKDARIQYDRLDDSHNAHEAPEGAP
jgi:hypothetical protein